MAFLGALFQINRRQLVDVHGGPTGAHTNGFKVGDRVRHATFGEGQVLTVKQSGEDQEVTVMFNRAGTKRLLASMARLDKL